MKTKKCRNSIPFVTRYLKFPIFNLLGRRFPRYYKELKTTQYLSLEELRKLQFIKFKKIFQIAYDNVGFYRNLYNNLQIKPENIKSISDLEKLPIISKAELKEAYPESTINKEYPKKKIIENSTSGSTGKPFVFALDWYKKDKIEALKIRNFEYAGYGYGRRIYSLWGFTPHLTFSSKLFQKIILRRKLLSSLELDEKKKELYSRILIDNPNSFLDGYSSALILLAKHMISKGIKADLCGVISTAESLHSTHRKLLEQAYGSKIYNRYGTREFGDIAMDCYEHKGMHINMESFIVEIIDEDGNPCKPDEDGRIIVTDLDNRVMPFIRFDTEDSSAFQIHHCSCGRSSELLKDPSGRIVDTITTPENKHLSFGYFVLKFEDFPIIDQFQVVQTDSQNIDLLIVKNIKFDEKLFKPLLEEVKEYCKPMKVNVVYVNNIPKEPSGKMRIVKGLSEI